MRRAACSAGMGDLYAVRQHSQQIRTAEPEERCLWLLIQGLSLVLGRTSRQLCWTYSNVSAVSGGERAGREPIRSLM